MLFDFSASASFSFLILFASALSYAIALLSTLIYSPRCITSLKVTGAVSLINYSFGISSITNPRFLNISIIPNSCYIKNAPAVPCLLALPVRPALCTKLSIYFGRSNYSTADKPSMSNPRAAISVVNNTEKSDFTKLLYIFNCDEEDISPVRIKDVISGNNFSNTLLK